ncbi:patatin family protein [Planococcus plakortidis]|uniref:Patatin family protein n=1 Tax=Planococcus plakortidis TaxID=1038856 RepID=A0A1C7E9H4_9BACL|nr:patatin family protein [Planococcus plakortidis]ANU20335.1 patatin family protein [Planococcus plakortidis]
MVKSGLILEGGGMRGVYTAGVLQKFMEENLFTDYVIGVSAGACNAVSYLSRQSGRNRTVMIDYVTHPDYISMKNLLKKRELFGMNLIFDDIPNRLVPFDYDGFGSAAEEFVVGTTDCMTGEAIYYRKPLAPDELLKVVRASSSLPFMSHPVEFGGRLLMDGSLADPLPIGQALSDGVSKPIVVMTREKNYRKRQTPLMRLAPAFARQYPGLAKALEDRQRIYNESLERIEALEAHNDAIIVRPRNLHRLRGIERDQERLAALYVQGYRDAELVVPRAKKFIMHQMQ